MSKIITRRDFLRASTAAAAGMAITPARSLWNVTGNSSAEKVIIIGAGLGGVSCAYELQNAGIDITVLEARSRPGGRVRTYRDPFADNLYAEMGAEYVDSSDEYARKYCKEFGLDILPAKLYDGIYVRGKKYDMADFKTFKQQLPYDGTVGGKLFGQEFEYVRHWVEKIKDPNDIPSDVMKLDRMSAAQLLRKEGAPKDIIELYTYTNATESTCTPDQMSALNMVFGHFYASAFSENTMEGRIFGGNDQLPKRFAKEIASNLKYNCPVKKISHNKKGVEVSFEESGKLTAMSADRCVIAMPLTILRKTKITPYFSDEKMHCIRKQSYGEVMKIAMQFKRRIWDEQGSVGQRVFTDTPLRRVYHFSIDQPGPRGILLSFTSGSPAAKVGNMCEQPRLRVARETATELWPETPYVWESGISKYWNEDPWMQGSYTYVSPGQWDFIDILAQPEEKVHFAGEHTSEFHSSMNGAIESGVRASKEIIKG
jgi:monoamine oxidase